MTQFFLDISNISLKFAKVNTLDTVSFCANKGDVICLVGQSGCGKSSLLRAIAGIERPDKNIARQHCTQIIERLGLSKLVDRFPHMLSKGKKHLYYYLVQRRRFLLLAFGLWRYEPAESRLGLVVFPLHLTMPHACLAKAPRVSLCAFICRSLKLLLLPLHFWFLLIV